MHNPIFSQPFLNFQIFLFEEKNQIRESSYLLPAFF